MANITGTTGPDTITPDEVSAGVTGGQPSGEDDNIFGDDGADTIDGGKGSDTVDGGDGNDLLISGADDLGDNDLLSGGLGSDTFQFSGNHRDDQILDFTDGEDRIDLSSYRGISFDSLSFSTEETSNTVISGYRSGAEITLQEVSAADLDESDFIFTDEVSQFPIVSLGAVNMVRDEGDEGTTTSYNYKVIRTGGDLSLRTEVSLRIDPGDTDANDWRETKIPPGPDLTFAPGQEELRGGFANSGDTDVEADESFTLFIDTVSFGVIDQDAASLNGTMVNDDPGDPADSPVIGITASANQEEGNEGAKDFTFTLTRSGSDAALASESTVVVLFDPRETDAADFVGGLPSPTQIVTFAAGEETQPLTILVAGDTDFENDEAFELELQSRTNGTIFVPATSAEALILNDDEEEPPDPSDRNLVEGSDQSEFLPGSAGKDVILGKAGDDVLLGGDDNDILDGGAGEDILEGDDGADILIGGTGKDILNGGGGNDILRGGGDQGDVFWFEGNFGNDIIVDYSNGDDAYHFDVTNRDAITSEIVDSGTLFTVDSAETFGTVLLQGVFPDEGADTGNSIYISDVQLAEGDSGTTTDAVFTVSLSTPVGDAVTVDYATADGTAAAGSDYTAVDGTLTFAPGETVQEVRVPITGDGAIEPNESFFVNLSNPVNDVIADGQGKATIVDDDGDGADQTGTSADEVFDGTDGDNVLQGSDGDDALNGLAGDDVLSGRGGDDTLDGGAGDDILAGGSGDDTLDGGGDDDVLGSGNDELQGGAGNDSLAGGSGDDQLSGGAGNDTLIGGSGNDSFVFTAADDDSGQDTIRMFNAGEDTLAFEDYGERLNAFADLDTNTNGVLDDGDANVSVDAGNTVIDFGGQTEGAIAGTLTLVGVTGLVADDLAFG